ncbi:MAG: hypothetical protein IKN41_03745 [Candidatus Methanomethylophilaceae archaeon]|nr:hypothetical protein [Candidatus Methanomethylophilaceae archaeon]
MTDAVQELLDGFESGNVPLLEFIRSAKRLQEEGLIANNPALGTAVVTCFGRHSEGRDLMSTLLIIQGFTVISADRDSSLDEIVKMCNDPKVTVLCMSVQTTYDCPESLRMSELLREAGIRDRIVLNIGGAAISDEMALKAGCDVYSRTASGSVKMIKEEVQKRIHDRCWPKL